MMTLGDISESIEKALGGQSGVALGLILGGLLTALGFRYFMNAQIENVKSIVAATVENTKATNRLCRVVANLLIESELKSIQQKGREALSEMGDSEQ